MLVPVVLAGGVGSRLWPVSRTLLPKQFISLGNTPDTLFQATLRRLAGLDCAAPLVLCNEEHRFLVAEQLRQLDVQGGQIVLEPVGRNTAPAVAIAAILALREDPDATLLVLPADHAIEDAETLVRVFSQGRALAQQGAMVTFGIVPGHPETGYGYIEAGEPVEDVGDARQIKRFVEKPDLETAKSYLEAGGFYWNSGMFMFRADRFLEELEKHASDIFQACSTVCDALAQGDEFVRLDKDGFAACRSDSIDYAVMEHTANGVVIPLDAGWNDLGSWDAMLDIGEQDGDGNVLDGDVLSVGTTNSYIKSESRLVAAVGIENAVIVDTADAVLVASRDKVQDVKQIVANLQESDRQESNNHTLVYRPWGSYESLATGDGYQVKHLVIKPGASISLQLHHHRAEHWTVLRGTAEVIRGEDEITLQEQEHVFIPLGAKHRLSNPGEKLLEVIEVQMGDYLGEDDIVRFEDVYGRIEQK